VQKCREGWKRYWHGSKPIALDKEFAKYEVVARSRRKMGRFSS